MGWPMDSIKNPFSSGLRRALIERAPLLFGQLADAQPLHTTDHELVAQNSIVTLSAWAAGG